jgi:hypothetical protein
MYEFNPVALSPKRKLARSMQEIQEPVLEDKILVLLASMSTNQFKATKESIHVVFHRLKEAFPSEFGELAFSNNERFPFSEKSRRAVSKISSFSGI